MAPDSIAVLCSATVGAGLLTIGVVLAGAGSGAADFAIEAGEASIGVEASVAIGVEAFVAIGVEASVSIGEALAGFSVAACVVVAGATPVIVSVTIVFCTEVTGTGSHLLSSHDVMVITTVDS